MSVQVNERESVLAASLRDLAEKKSNSYNRTAILAITQKKHRWWENAALKQEHRSH